MNIILHACANTSPEERVAYSETFIDLRDRSALTRKVVVQIIGRLSELLSEDLALQGFDPLFR